ncbi:hypothetical protein TNCV_3428661 [Trichonephila clavipes]|nr:hypothetical protein TNCV_3428661 [Trichonephila clavipes]
MPYPGFKPSPNGTAVSVTNHYTGWGGGYWDSGSVERKPGKGRSRATTTREDRPFLVIASYGRAFGDGSRNFEPWSRDEDDIWAAFPLQTTTARQQEDLKPRQT